MLPAEVSAEEVKKAKQGSSAVVRVAKYMAVRVLLLAMTVVIGVYLTILIANMGGYVDEIRRGEIRETISQRTLTDPALKALDAGCAHPPPGGADCAGRTTCRAWTNPLWCAALTS